MDIYYTRHARQRMRERGVSESEVRRALERGSKHLQPPNKIVATYTYFRVVYKRHGKKIIILTVEPRW